MPFPFQPTALAVGISALTIFSPQLTVASEAIAQPKMDTIVVTATRSEEKLENVPARISVIAEPTIQQSPMSNLGDFLRRDAALNIVQSGGLGQTSSAFIRGTDSKHILFLKDGVSLNTALDGGANIPYIDMSDVQQIEILRGPASVQYGTDAVGGVVNVISKTPEKTGAFTTAEVGENKTYKAVVGANLKDESGFYAQLRGQRLESDGTPVTNKSKTNASYDQKGYSAKFGYDQNKIKTSLSYSENEGNNVFYGGAQDFLNHVLQLNASLPLHEKLQLKAQYSNFEDELISTDGSYLFDTQRDEADLSLNWKISEHHQVLMGASLNQADIESYNILGQKQQLDSIGYYLQHQFDTDTMHTQAGIRLEDHDQFGTHTVGQLAGRLDLTPSTSIYSNIGTAFKTPTGNQLYYFYEDPMWGNTYGNPNLKPEESISYEIGIDQQLSSRLSSYASLYQTKVKNLIEYDNGYPDATYFNTSKAKMTGGEIGFKWKFNDLFINTEYAYVKTENEDTGLELIRRPRQSFSTVFGLENEVYGLSAALIAKSTSKISNSANSKELPGYATIDLNGYWNINPNIKLFSNIRNIGDVKFKTASYYGDEFYINGGRLASAGISFKY